MGIVMGMYGTVRVPLVRVVTDILTVVVVGESEVSVEPSCRRSFRGSYLQDEMRRARKIASCRWDELPWPQLFASPRSHVCCCTSHSHVPH